MPKWTGEDRPWCHGSTLVPWLISICCFALIGIYASVEQTAGSVISRDSKLSFIVRSGIEFVSNVRVIDFEDEYITTDQEVVLDPRDKDYEYNEADDDVDSDLNNRSSQFVRVALYVAKGTTSNAKRNVPFVLRKCSNQTIQVDKIYDASLSTVGRRKYDVILIPGGGAGSIYKEMTKQASKRHSLYPKQKFQRFLSKGGGYVGICAGAYLAKSLGITMYRSRRGLLGDGFFSESELDEAMKTERLLAPGLNEDRMKTTQLFYANGPIFQNRSIPVRGPLHNPKVILRIGTSNKSKLQIMKGGTKRKWSYDEFRGSPIMVMNDFRKGRVVLSTGHPETSALHLKPGLGWVKPRKPSECDSPEAKLLVSMVYLAANRKPPISKT